LKESHKAPGEYLDVDVDELAYIPNAKQGVNIIARNGTVALTLEIWLWCSATRTWKEISGN